MSLPQLQDKLPRTYADYMTWDEGRWELIQGEVWDMTPAPAPVHQEILGNLLYILMTCFKGTRCKVYAAPFDVRLPEGGNVEDLSITTVVQPDISVICDPVKLDERGCVGAPDLIVEILSPATAARDLKVKRDLYEKHGVQEYWLVHPADKVLMSYVLGNNGQYGKSEVFDTEDTVLSAQFENLEVILAHIFPENEEQ